MPPETFISDFIWSARTAFPSIFLVVGGTYIISALMFHNIASLLRSKGLNRYKIQQREARRTDYLRELWTSARTIAIFALVGTIMLWIYGGPRATQPSTAPLWSVILHTIIVLIFHDAWFYWTHRLIHLKGFYKKWHRTHHKSATPTPFTAFAFDWREGVLLVLFSVVYSAIVPIPQPPMASLAFLIIMVFKSVWGHCGIELHPGGFADHWFFQHFTTTTHHDLHHSGSFACNFGLYFTWWDRLMGTEHPRYRQIFRDVCAHRSNSTHSGSINISTRP